MTRPDGLYWVRVTPDSRWLPALWDRQFGWSFIGREDDPDTLFWDDYITEIGGAVSRDGVPDDPTHPTRTTEGDWPVTTDHPFLNPAQVIACRIYSAGAYAYLLECRDPDTMAAELDVCGDTLFKFLMIELSNKEGCDDLETAVQRVKTAERELGEVKQALASNEPVQTYKVCVQRWIEQTGIVEVEASSPEVAAERVRRDFAAGNPAIEWGPGDDIDREDVYAVMDETGETVWER